jgi:hypothetical protein
MILVLDKLVFPLAEQSEIRFRSVSPSKVHSFAERPNDSR